MKKFQLGEDIREIAPSEENKIIITTLDIVIERIIKIHSFKSLFENLGYTNYYPEGIDRSYKYCYNNFKDFLEEKFSGVFKGNKYGMIPPLYYWLISFDKISISLNKEQMQNLLGENYDLYKNKINHKYDNVFELNSPLFYDLSEDKFTNHI